MQQLPHAKQIEILRMWVEDKLWIIHKW
jgi:hypothetical protein